MNIGKVKPSNPTSTYNMREDNATSTRDRMEPILRYSLSVNFKPPRLITSNHINIAKDPMGKKWGRYCFR